MRKPFIALALVTGAALVAGCGTGRPRADTGLGDVPGLTGGTTAKPVVRLRVVNVEGPGHGRVDVVDDTKKVLIADVRPGTATDYVSVPMGATVTEQGSAGTAGIFGGPPPDKPDARATVVLTDDGADTFWEADGRIGRYGQGPDGVEWKPPAAGRALVALRLDAGGRSGDRESFDLAGPGTACVPVPPENQTPGGGKTVLNNYVFYPFDTGDHELVLSNWVHCRAASTGKARFSLRAGQTVYAFPWFAKKTELRMVVVPVTADGPGNAGVVVSGGGVEFAPSARQSADQNEPPTTIPDTTSNPTPDPTDETTTPTN